MSWFFGFITSNSKPLNTEYYQRIHLKSEHIISSPNLYIAIGGIDETHFYETSNESKNIGWLVVGLGIRLTGTSAKFLNKNDWRNFLSKDTLKTDSIDGHFVILRWNNNQIELFSDQLGLRTAYYAKCDDGICFSTRLDWIAQVTNYNEINVAALGSRWLLFNQLNYESCVNGIERLGPSAHVIIKNKIVLKQANNYWLPEFKNGEGNKVDEVLKVFVNLAFDTEYKVSLALSGGFDSRMILATLMSISKSEFVVHTFGEPLDPDVIISKNIADSFGIQMQYFNYPFPANEDLLSLVKSFVAQNILVEPASSVLRLRYYNEQYQKKRLIIDGGFGEIGRRQYLNRVIKLGRGALQNKDVKRLFQLMQTPRAQIFNTEFTTQLKLAAYESLDKMLENMPSIDEIGVENFADLFSVRTRVPNFGGPEQARSDCFILNYMPLAQPSFLREIFKTKINMRKNGRLFKNIIKSKEPHLTKFPLVKGGTTYPYGSPLLAAWLITKIKSKIWTPYSNSTPNKFLINFRDYVLDILYSDEVKNIDYYDYDKIRNSVEAYYHGEEHFQQFVNWWFTFELWRRSLKA